MASFQLSLKEGHRPSALYIERLRRELPQQFPGAEFFFQPADMVTQILNFGLPAAIDVVFSGSNLRSDYEFAARLMKQIKQIPGTVDTHIHQRARFADVGARDGPHAAAIPWLDRQ